MSTVLLSYCTITADGEKEKQVTPISCVLIVKLKNQSILQLRGFSLKLVGKFVVFANVHCAGAVNELDHSQGRLY